jgi:ribosomal protein L37E
MSKRARELAEYLETVLGWEVYEDRRDCYKCGEHTYGRDKNFCSSCGSKLSKVKRRKKLRMKLKKL